MICSCTCELTSSGGMRPGAAWWHWHQADLGLCHRPMLRGRLPVSQVPDPLQSLCLNLQNGDRKTVSRMK